MKDNLILGMAIGVVIGGLLVHSNKKAQQFIEDAKDCIQEKIEKI